MVFFAGKFFKSLAIGKKLFSLFFGLLNLGKVIIAFVNNTLVLRAQVVLVNKIVFIKKGHPYQKHQSDDFELMLLYFFPYLHPAKLRLLAKIGQGVINRPSTFVDDF